MGADDWKEFALCKDKEATGVPTDWFFAEADTPEERAAKQVCRQCPVRLDCLEAHLREPWGVWGALNDTERRSAYRRRQRRARQEAVNGI